MHIDWLEMEANNVHLDPIACSSLMEALNRGGQPAKVLWLLDLMRKRSIPLNSSASFEVISACSLLRDRKTVNELIEHLVPSLSSVSFGLLNQLLHFLGKSGTAETMMKVAAFDNRVGSKYLLESDPTSSNVEKFYSSLMHTELSPYFKSEPKPDEMRVPDCSLLELEELGSCWRNGEGVLHPGPVRALQEDLHALRRRCFPDSDQKAFRSSRSVNCLIKCPCLFSDVHLLLRLLKRTMKQKQGKALLSQLLSLLATC